SSPCWYSRTSANSMPWPRKTERYSPVNSVLTRFLVRSSIPLTCRSTSVVTARRRARTGGVAPLRRSFPSYVTARPRPPGSERSRGRPPCPRLPRRMPAARGGAHRPGRSPGRARPPRRHACHDLLLRIACRVADAHLQHEAIELRLREGVGAFLLDRVLRRQDKERLPQIEGLPADRHLLFLHRLEQRRLHLGGRPIDLVGEHQVREQRAFLRIELLTLLVEHHGADHVGREQVGRE